jgi:hypothetical protein
VQVVEALPHKTGGPGFASEWRPWKFSSDRIVLSAISIPGVHSASNRNDYHGISLGGKFLSASRTDNSCRPSCAECQTKDWKPNIPSPLLSLHELLRETFTSFFYGFQTKMRESVPFPTCASCLSISSALFRVFTHTSFDNHLKTLQASVSNPR